MLGEVEGTNSFYEMYEVVRCYNDRSILDVDTRPSSMGQTNKML